MNRVDLLNLMLSINFILVAPALSAQQSHTLTVVVEGAKVNQGQAIVSLFASAENYLKKPLVEHALSIDQNGSARFVIGDLSDGIYAVSVVYDEDLNGKLNTGFLGIPSELVGFSNNAKSRFGPPSFKKTSFKLLGDQSMTIRLSSARD